MVQIDNGISFRCTDKKEIMAFSGKWVQLEVIVLNGNNPDTHQKEICHVLNLCMCMSIGMCAYVCACSHKTKKGIIRGKEEIFLNHLFIHFLCSLLFCLHVLSM